MRIEKTKRAIVREEVTRSVKPQNRAEGWVGDRAHAESFAIGETPVDRFKDVTMLDLDGYEEGIWAPVPASGGGNDDASSKERPTNAYFADGSRACLCAGGWCVAEPRGSMFREDRLDPRQWDMSEAQDWCDQENCIIQGRRERLWRALRRAWFLVRIAWTPQSLARPTNLSASSQIHARWVPATTDEWMSGEDETAHRTT